MLNYIKAHTIRYLSEPQLCNENLTERPASRATVDYAKISFVVAAEYMHRGEVRGEGVRLDLGGIRFTVQEAMKFREPRRGEWAFREYMRVWGWKVFTTARCECACSAVAGGSHRSLHCTTQMCPTPVRGSGRELSTLTPHRAGRKAAPWAPRLQGSYHTPTTYILPAIVHMPLPGHHQ